MAVAYNYSSTAGSYTLTGAVSAGATALTINSTTGLPGTTPFKVVIDPGTTSEEIVKVTSVAGLTLTVIRAWDGTTGVSHLSSAVVRHMMTAEDLTLSRAHEAALAAHGTTGAIVGISDVQTLTNKNLTSATNTFPTTLATLTGAQSLTNKDLTSGSNTFPGTLVTLAGAQTLTNKVAQAASASVAGFSVIGASGQTANHFEVKTSDNVVRFSIGADGAFRMDSGFTVFDSAWANLGTNVALIQPTVPANRALVLKGAASQTANLMEFQNSAGTVLASVDANGNISSPNVTSWAAFTPTWSGVAVSSTWGKFSRTGNLCQFEVFLKVSGTQSGNVTLNNLPVATTAYATTGVYQFGAGLLHTGTGHYYTVILEGVPSLGPLNLMVQANGGSYPLYIAVSPTIPESMANGDVIHLSGSYSIA